jgi:hypothetical protein
MIRRTPQASRAFAALVGLGLLGLTAGGITCANGSALPPGSGGSGGTGGETSTSTSAGGLGGGTSSSSTSSVSAGASGTGGAGGSTSTASGTSSSTGTSSSSGSGGSGGGGGAGGGGPAPATKIFSVYGGGSAVIANVYDVIQASAFSTPYNDPSDDAIGVALIGDGTVIAMARAKNSGELRYARWNGTWAPAFGSQLLPVQIGLLITGGPSAAGSSNKGHVAYQGTDMKFYYAAEQGGLWNPTQEPITAAAQQSTGPVPPAIAMSGADPLVAFVGADGDVYDQIRAGGVWQAAQSHGVAGQAASVTPALTPLLAGPELLLVFTQTGTSALEFSLRSAGVWSAPAPIAGAVSDDPVSIAALTAGGALLAYRGKDGHIYTALLSSGAQPSWSAPVMGVGGSNPTLVAPPAVATGAKGAQAELLYIDSNFTLDSSRLVGGVWSAPAFAGSASGRIGMVTGL